MVSRVSAAALNRMPYIRLVVVGDVGDLLGQREQHVEIRHGKQVGLARGEPFPRCPTQTLRTVPIAAAIVGDERVCAVLATHDVAAEGRGAASLDRRQDLQLPEAHVTGVGLAPRRSMLAEDVRDLQRWTRHR